MVGRASQLVLRSGLICLAQVREAKGPVVGQNFGMPINMPWAGNGKQDLPAPYDQDLTEIVRYVNARSSRERAKKSNSRDAALYLRAGMSLLRDHLGPDRACECQPWHDPSRLLSFLSQRNVEHKAQQAPESDRPGKGLRIFWCAQQDYVADLVGFALWAETYRPGYSDVRTGLAVKLASGPDFVQAVHEATYQYAAEGTEEATIRMSLALMAACGGEPDIAAAISGAYRNHLGLWTGLYEQVMNARKLRLRPGLTTRDLTNAISAATDGIILRAAGDPQAGVLDRAHRTSLLGQITLAIIYAFLEPQNEADGLTLEQAVARRY
jgi:hypothetical protein